MTTLFSMILGGVVVGAVAYGPPASAAPPSYAVSVVQSGPGTIGVDINKKARVVVSAPGNLALRCSSKKCIQIPALSNEQGSEIVRADDINDAGWVVGSSPISPTIYHAMLFDGSKSVDVGAFDEDDCGGCTFNSSATGVNDHGQVVGTSETAKGPGFGRAFRWENGVMKKLPTLGGISSIGHAINNHGDIAGFSNIESDGNVEGHAFMFRRGVMMDLGVLGTGLSSGARAINDKGQVVGWSMTDGWNVMRPFLYANGLMSEIPPLPVQFLNSEAFDINDKGWVVGQAVGPGETSRAWLFDGVATYEPNQLLSAADQALWDVRSALGINNQGEIVANGRARSDGSWHVLLLTPMP